MSKLIAFIFAAAAAARLWFDWQETVGAGETFAMTSLGTFWTEQSPESLARVQGLTERFLPLETQASGLQVPLAALLLVLAALFWFVSRIPETKRKQFGR